MYQEDEKVQVRRRQADAAIQLAMSNRWEEAAQANRSILTLFPNDADAHNRLGKALMELGRYPDAKKSYKKALELDPTNQIARKNLERMQTLAKAGGGTAEASQIDPTLFIEEMGKSAVTTLSGDRCKLIIKETYQHPSQAGRPSFPTAIAAEGMRPYTKESLVRHGTQIEELERDEGEEEERSGDEEPAEAWDGETVLQEGHVRLNDAVAAEEAADDEIEE